MERIILTVLAILAIFSVIVIRWILRAPPGRETRRGYRSEPENPGGVSGGEGPRAAEEHPDDSKDSKSSAA